MAGTVAENYVHLRMHQKQCVKESKIQKFPRAYLQTSLDVMYLCIGIFTLVCPPLLLQNLILSALSHFLDEGL